MKVLNIIKPIRPHLTHRALPLAALALMALASSAAAAPLYQESFATPCTSADFATTYPGFTKSGPAVNVNADGHASTDSAAGESDGLWRTMPESMPIYDWTLPLTISAEIGAADATGGQSIGVFFGNASGLATAGITFRPFIPSVPNGANVESANGYNRGVFGIGGNSAIDPGVAGGGALTKISFTIRQNADDSSKFDWLAKVNDTEVWSGWHLGIPKSNLNASGGLSTFGLGYDGMTPRIDNLTLELEGTVTTMDTTTSVVSSNNPSTFGDAVNFIATVAPVSGVAVPVGTVQFKVDGTDLKSPVPVTLGGIATTGTTTIPSAGSPHEVTAVFLPATSSFNTSTGTLPDGQTVLAGPAPLYQESFSTPSDSTAFSATYPGFTQLGPAVNVDVAGYASTDSAAGEYSGGLWRTMPVYDWSGPLTVSAQIGAADGIGGNSIGVFFSDASGLATAGITFRPFIPSDTNGAYVGSSDGSNRNGFGLGGNTAIVPGVAGGGALTKISFTIRQNAGNPLLFDWLARVNDTEVWTDGTSGWHLGIPKSYLNASGGLSTFGLGYDGITPRIDNLTLEGPASATTETVVTGTGTSTVGDTVTLTATVTPPPTGGTVQFYDDTTDTDIGSAQSASGGSVTVGADLTVGTHSIIATFSGTDGFLGSVSPVVTQTVLSKYEKWAVDKLLITGNNGPNDDPDADGVPNYMEFAFNGNPKSAADNGMIHVLTEDSTPHSGKVLVLTIAVRLDTGTPQDWTDHNNTGTVDGITYTIEGGTSLGDLRSDPSWVSACAAPITTGLSSTPGSGYEWRSFILESSVGLGTKGFLRAKVVQD